MFTILEEFVTLLFLQIVGSKKDRQELSECSQHNTASLRQIHQQYRTIVVQATASTNCMIEKLRRSSRGHTPANRMNSTNRRRSSAFRKY